MDFQKEKILKDIIKDEDIKKLLSDNNISIEQLDKEFLSVYSYYIMKKKCTGCKSLSSCNQDIDGMKPVLCYNGMFYTEYIPCKYLNQVLKEEEKKNNLITLACNLDYIDPTTLFMNVNRNEVYKRMKQIFNDVMEGLLPKGLYLYGPYGTGKSYVMSCFASKYAENGKKVVFAYFPDLVRKIKSSIGTSQFEEIIDTLKYADVLFLDDFGGETTTSFIRDEVLGAVFQERMENRSLTFITSNLDQNALHNHLAETAKDIDHLKASRIEERIKTLMDFILLNGENYRK